MTFRDRELSAARCRAPAGRVSNPEGGGASLVDQVDVWARRGELSQVSGMEGGVVLLVDDDESWLRACERGLRSLTSAVHVATGAAEALALAREHTPDLVVADLRLRGESGVELIEPLRAALPHSTIVVVSAYLSVAVTAEVMRKGADQVLFKPVDPSEILRRARLPEVADAEHAWTTPTLARAEWEHISRVLLDCNGNVSEAARRLGILRQSLQRRLRKHPPSQ
jgi:two-component system response regulator RegA